MQRQKIKYFAFISYSSKDEKWGKRLHKKLEGYRMPSTLCRQNGWKRTPINPVFFAPYDIQPNDLREELKERLRLSENLIVICSPNSAQSHYVGLEIEYFHQLGRTNNIYFFIIDGIPHSGDITTECFNPVTEKLGMPEILGANIHEKVYRWAWLNKERAYVQIITKLLGVEFDYIWRRHRRMLIQHLWTWGIGLACIILALIGVWLVNYHISVEVSLKEVTVHNDKLPKLCNAVVSLKIENETKSAVINKVGDVAVFNNVPARLIGKKVKFCFTCENWCTIDTTLVLKRNLTIGIARDVNAFGHVRFTLYDLKIQPVANTTILLSGYKTASNSQGVVDIIIPIEKQNIIYDITSSSVTLQDTLIEAKCGDSDAIFIK